MRSVKVLFTDDLLKQIDQAAGEESGSRSEVIRQAVRSYIQRKQRWAELMEAGQRTARSLGLHPKDVEEEIRAFRDRNPR